MVKRSGAGEIRPITGEQEAIICRLLNEALRHSHRQLPWLILPWLTRIMQPMRVRDNQNGIEFLKLRIYKRKLADMSILDDGVLSYIRICLQKNINELILSEQTIPNYDNEFSVITISDIEDKHVYVLLTILWVDTPNAYNFILHKLLDREESI